MLTNDELKLAKKKYQGQAGHCCGRIDQLGNPIEMRLTFEQWIDIWLLSGHWHERGRGKGQYVMSRFNDIGHYEIGNVEIKTHSDNIIENNQSSEWQEKHTLATQTACNKQISCDGVIYESKITAALALAPETRLTHGSKSRWFEVQMKKYPERYFYI